MNWCGNPSIWAMTFNYPQRMPDAVAAEYPDAIKTFRIDIDDMLEMDYPAPALLSPLDTDGPRG